MALKDTLKKVVQSYKKTAQPMPASIERMKRVIEAEKKTAKTPKE